MIKLTKNDPNITINRIYPYHLEDSWEQVIDCSRESLEGLYEQIKAELHPESEPVNFPINCDDGGSGLCKHKKECKHTYLDCLKFSREDFHL